MNDEPKRPSKKDAPVRCPDCGRRYGVHGPIRFRGKWVCGRCLLTPSDVIDTVST